MGGFFFFEGCCEVIGVDNGHTNCRDEPEIMGDGRVVDERVGDHFCGFS